MGNTFNVSGITIKNRVGCGTACDGRIKELKIFISQNPITNYNTQTTLIYSSSVGLKDGDLLNFNNLNLSGRYVKVWGKNSGTATWLHLSEVTVLGCAGTNTCVGNQPPNPFTLSSSPNTSQPVGSIFNLSTNPSDNDGTISKVEFYSGNSKIGESLIAPYTFDFTPVSPASYILLAKAFDDCGAVVSSNNITITAIPSTSNCTVSSNISLGKTIVQSSNYNSSNSTLLL
ncbi:MAG: hypothetical protein IPI77_19495 [Saprospiraceae bacterium]|nr:hypothetical protein [Saprospiraceae bacterium]